MKARVLVMEAVLLLALNTTADADSNDRINRKYAQENFRAYRNVMRVTYPSPFAIHFGQPFAQRFWGYVDNRVLQPNGPADDILATLTTLAKLAIAKVDAETDAKENSIMRASRAPSPDPDLQNTLEKTRAILKTLKLEEPEEIKAEKPQGNQPQANGNPGDSNKDYSHFDESVLKN